MRCQALVHLVLVRQLAVHVDALQSILTTFKSNPADSSTAALANVHTRMHVA